MPDAAAPTRLTSLAHGGGCGCKLAPAVLSEILAGMPQPGTIGAAAFANLLVGLETGDDAAVWRLNDTQALVATTDFFTPIVDDPFDFGRIAAANALSDIYAMGGTPIFALALLGAPLGKLDLASVRQIVAGGAAICGEAGIPVAGGHSIDSPEPLYGLVALGLVAPDHVLRNSRAQAGDLLVLTKALGVGIYSAALRRDLLSKDQYAAMIASTTQLNRIGASLPGIAGVHAVTDVTGFGLLGHALELCRGSGLVASIDADKLPLLDGVEALAGQGIVTGAARRNWESYGASVALRSTARQPLLIDPQTSGGLLIAVAPEAAPDLLARLAADGFSRAAIIGDLHAGPPTITICEGRAA